ncbi:MAG: membrane protein insertion efficiency factor YidD [Vicinamibacterales bacterium]
MTLRIRWAAIAVTIVAAIAADAQRAPANQWSGRAALAGIHLYQATLSPVYARLGVDCRFSPTCSRYGEVVIQKYGFVRGGWMSLKRIARCGPWTPKGTLDPP